MNLEQRVDFHKSLLHVIEKDELSDNDRNLLREIRASIYEMCRCWPCSIHEHIPAVYLGCEHCHVCAQHSHSLDVYAGKR